MRSAVISFDEARTRVFASIVALDVETTPLTAAAGAALAEDIVSPGDVPGFDTAAMDGYAVRHHDVSSTPMTLPVVAVSSAGRPTTVVVGPGEAARILTGAVLPEGTDSVVPVERTDGGLVQVRIDTIGAPGSHIRRTGELARRGDVLVRRGTVLHAGHLGVAAGAGRDTLRVVRRPNVAILSTGDELVEAGGAPLEPGQIYESNTLVLAQLVGDAGCAVEVHRTGDDPILIAKLLSELAERCDVLITSGGVSMGAEFDPLRAALADHDVEFWKIAMKPGKPLAFGRVGDAVMFGLPGNPGSAVVAFEVFVRPALRRLRGVTTGREDAEVDAGSVGGSPDGSVSGTAGEMFARRDDERTHFVPVRRLPDGSWVPLGGAGSQVVGGLADAEALALLAPGMDDVSIGDRLTLIPLWR